MEAQVLGDQLLLAAVEGNTDAVERLCSFGADTTATDAKTGQAAIHKAAARGHHSTVAVLALRNPKLVLTSDSAGQTPLHWACFCGCYATVSLLVEKGASVAALDRGKRTPAHVAMAKGLQEVVKLLIENGCPDPGLKWPSGSKRKYDLSSYWTPDSEAATCMCCKSRKFTFSNRRHHCRQCGDVVCKSCCLKASPPWHSPMGNARVCVTCYNLWATEGQKPVAGSTYGMGTASNEEQQQQQQISEIDAEVGDVVAPGDVPLDDELLRGSEWFFPQLPRAEAERMLTVTNSLEGDYLLRTSSQPGCISLSVTRNNGTVSHRLVKYFQGQWFLWVPNMTTGRYTVFPTVAMLLEHYARPHPELQNPVLLRRPRLRSRPYPPTPRSPARPPTAPVSPGGDGLARASPLATPQRPQRQQQPGISPGARFAAGESPGQAASNPGTPTRPDVAAPPPSAEPHCGRCAAAVRLNARFCPICGSPDIRRHGVLPAPPAQPAAVPPPLPVRGPRSPIQPPAAAHAPSPTGFVAAQPGAPPASLGAGPRPPQPLPQPGPPATAEDGIRRTELTVVAGGSSESLHSIEAELMPTLSAAPTESVAAAAAQEPPASSSAEDSGSEFESITTLPDGLRYCPSCWAVLSPQSKFCGICGTRSDPPTVVQAVVAAKLEPPIKEEEVEAGADAEAEVEVEVEAEAEAELDTEKVEAKAEVEAEVDAVPQGAPDAAPEADATVETNGVAGPNSAAESAQLEDDGTAEAAEPNVAAVEAEDSAVGDAADPTTEREQQPPATDPDPQREDVPPEPSSDAPEAAAPQLPGAAVDTEESDEGASATPTTDAETTASDEANETLSAAEGDAPPTSAEAAPPQPAPKVAPAELFGEEEEFDFAVVADEQAQKEAERGDGVFESELLVTSKDAANDIKLEPLADTWKQLELSRVDAENLLLRREMDTGAFLVRKSSQAGYAISLRNNDCVKHYRVLEKDGKLFVQGAEAKFDTLELFVEYHRKHSGSLCTRLRMAAPLASEAISCTKCKSILQEMDRYCESCGTPVEKPVEIVVDQWELQRKSIKLGRKLAEGNFGKVHKGTYKGTTVAIKMSKADKMSSRSFLAEAEQMKQLQHVNIVALVGVSTVQSPIMIVIEFVSDGCLLDYLRSKKGRRLTVTQLVSMARGVAGGMAFLEKGHWVHGDLAARNILVQSGLVCKVCDFGHMVRTDDKNTPLFVQQQLPVRWTAPEFFRSRRCNTTSDVWSFGVVLFEIFSLGGDPYRDMPDNREVMDKLNNGWRMGPPPGCPQQVYHSMLQCWKGNPAERPSFRMISAQYEEWGAMGDLIIDCGLLCSMSQEPLRVDLITVVIEAD